MTQIDADVKKWLSFVSLCLCARMGLQQFCTMASRMSIASIKSPECYKHPGILEF